MYIHIDVHVHIVDGTEDTIGGFWAINWHTGVGEVPGSVDMLRKSLPDHQTPMLCNRFFLNKAALNLYQPQ